MSQHDQDFTINNAEGRPMVSVRRDGENVALTVRTRRHGDPALISREEAFELGRALERLSLPAP